MGYSMGLPSHGALYSVSLEILWDFLRDYLWDVKRDI